MRADLRRHLITTPASRAGLRNVPDGRIGDPAELARLAAWALLDAPGVMARSVLVADGGQTAGFAALPAAVARA
jgi:NAD(P)-dependent dehydrogenase (short-subunit alcohol dehydrogenase family)